MSCHRKAPAQLAAETEFGPNADYDRYRVSHFCLRLCNTCWQASSVSGSAQLSAGAAGAPESKNSHSLVTSKPNPGTDCGG